MTSVSLLQPSSHATIADMRNRATFRALAGAHVLIAVPLMPMTAFFGLLLAPILMAGPIWLGVLGVRLWRGTSTRLVKQVRVTHCFALLFALLLFVVGILDFQAAERSAAHGGGLMGALGLFPIAAGLLLGSLAVVTLLLVRPAANPAT